MPIHSEILARFEEQNRLGGIDVRTLPPGTRLVIKTKNSTYDIEVIDGSRVTIRGGRKFSEATECWFNGSTWGGSVLRQGWVGYGMRMELACGVTVVTSPVQSARVIGENYDYEFDWTQA